MSNEKFKQRAQLATLRIGGALEILNVLKTFSIDPDEVLTTAGIDPDLFDNPDNLITYATRDRLLEHCVSETGCRHFGLLVGQKMNLHSLGVVGSLMKTSPDVETALRSLVNFIQVHSQGAAMALKIEDNIALLMYDTVAPVLDASGQTGDGAVAMMFNVMRELCGSSFKPVEASFAHRQPDDIQPFRKFFGVPVYFNAEHNTLVFSRTWLTARPEAADADIQALLRNQVSGLQAKDKLEFPEQVRNVLRSALMTGISSEEQIASLLSIHVRTLSRRLEQHGKSFHELVDECRFELAQQMLKKTTLGVNQISDSLGYSRASSFVRAFRRWSGSTPGQWRDDQSSAD